MMGGRYRNFSKFEYIVSVFLESMLMELGLPVLYTFTFFLVLEIWNLMICAWKIVYNFGVPEIYANGTCPAKLYTTLSGYTNLMKTLKSYRKD